MSGLTVRPPPEDVRFYTLERDSVDELADWIENAVLQFVRAHPKMNVSPMMVSAAFHALVWKQGVQFVIDHPDGK